MPVRVADFLAQARAQGVDRLDAQLLLGQALQQTRSWLLAHDDHALDDTLANALKARLRRRAAGEPLAYVLGETEFCGLRLQLTPAVLIPRPETELLVDWASHCLPDAPDGEIVDLGTGSGAVALALKHRHTVRTMNASDLSSAALAVAQANGARLGLSVNWLQGDWWQAHGDRRYALVVSNPPYVAGDDQHLDALTHEPRAALTPEGNGLSALRAIIDGAPLRLMPGAWLLLEHGHDQGEAVREMLKTRGFDAVQTRNDLAELPRCTGGRLPA